MSIPKIPTRESHIEAYLVKRAKELGGEVRKVKWIGRTGCLLYTSPSPRDA